MKKFIYIFLIMFGFSTCIITGQHECVSYVEDKKKIKKIKSDTAVALDYADNNFKYIDNYQFKK